MLLAEADGGNLTEPAFSGQRGTCPGCHAATVAKCGTQVVWHWAHLAGVDCDTWYEPRTEWHKQWQSVVPAYRREVPLGNHRADVVTADGRIVEFQHSYLSTEDITARESFYRGDLIWIWDAREAYEAERIRVWEKGDFVTFHWSHPRTTIAACRKVVYLDLGESLLTIHKLNPEKWSGWGKLWTLEEVENRLAVEHPMHERRYPTCADGPARARLTPPGPMDPRTGFALQDATLDTVTDGPCAKCHAPHTLYGPTGRPLCDDCDPRVRLRYCGGCGTRLDPVLWDVGYHVNCDPVVRSA